MITEKTEDQIQREKKQVDSLKGAQSNIKAALERISTLEFALREAADGLSAAAKFIPDTAYPINSQTSHREAVLAWAAKARAKL